MYVCERVGNKCIPLATKRKLFKNGTLVSEVQCNVQSEHVGSV